MPRFTTTPRTIAVGIPQLDDMAHKAVGDFEAAYLYLTEEFSFNPVDAAYRLFQAAQFGRADWIEDRMTIVVSNSGRTLTVYVW